MASLFGDVHPSKAKLTLLRDSNCSLIAFTVSPYSLRQILQRVVVDGCTWSSRNAIYDRRSCRFNIVLHAIWGETNPNRRSGFHVSWYNLEVSKSLADSLECVVCHFVQYGSMSMWNIIFLCEHTIVIPQLPCLFSVATAVSSTIQAVKSVTSDSID